MPIDARKTLSNGWNRDEASAISIPGHNHFCGNGIKMLFTALNTADSNQPINLSLLLNKYAWWHDSGSTYKFDPPELKKNYKNARGQEKTEKCFRRYDDELFDVIAELSVRQPAHYSEILARHCLEASGETVVTFDMKTITRLLVGMSSLNVYETGITLHPWYGFPYIPGSSIKGALLHYCQEFGKTFNMAIFGSSKGRGEVAFCDVWPAPWTGKLIVRDIINPHYPKYYDGNSALPADKDSPRPISILAVRENVEFRFCLRAKTTGHARLNEAVALLKESLITVGIGAKTGSSYGYFEEA